MTRDFLPLAFYYWTPSGPPVQQFKIFSIVFSISRSYSYLRISVSSNHCCHSFRNLAAPQIPHSLSLSPEFPYSATNFLRQSDKIYNNAISNNFLALRQCYIIFHNHLALVYKSGFLKLKFFKASDMIKQDWGRLHQGYSHHPWVHWSQAAAGIQPSSMSALIKGCNRDAVISHESTDQAGLRMTATGIQLSAEWVDQAGLRKTATGIQLSAEWALVKLDFERQQKRYSCQPREHWSNWTAKDCSRETVMRALMKLDYKRLQQGYSVISCGHGSQKIQS